jgi:hypothetical protein
MSKPPSFFEVDGPRCATAIAGVVNRLASEQADARAIVLALLSAARLCHIACRDRHPDFPSWETFIRMATTAKPIPAGNA